MKTSFSHGLLFVVFLFLVVTLLTYSIKKVTEQFNKEQSGFKSEIGQKVVLEKDTLLIIDYSSLMKTYTLSNGKEISFDLVSKLKKVK